MLSVLGGGDDDSRYFRSIPDSPAVSKMHNGPR